MVLNMIIDVHCHVFPDKVAAKASRSIAAFYDIPTVHDGTVESLLANGKRAGIGRFLIHSVATTKEQVEKANSFIAATVAEHEEFIGFGTMHPDYADFEGELARMRALGLNGIKLHPDIQGFPFDDARMHALYALMEGNIVLLVHAGDKRYDYSGPARIAAVLDMFPKLDVICAHLGGYSEWDEAERLLAGRRVWVDTCSSLPFIDKEKACRLIDAYGAERVLFGTDYPMWDAAEEMERFDALNLSEYQRERILWKNAAELLRLN
jgi:predicted TIM-barrel fold metal-dependent hydrolase